MWYTEKKLPVEVNYGAEYDDWRKQRVGEILSLNKGMPVPEARVREVISRYRGDSGLSRYKVDMITQCIMDVINEGE